MSCSASCHRGLILMTWHQIWEALMLTIFILVSVHVGLSVNRNHHVIISMLPTDFHLLSSTIKPINKWCLITSQDSCQATCWWSVKRRSRTLHQKTEMKRKQIVLKVPDLYKILFRTQNTWVYISHICVSAAREEKEDKSPARIIPLQPLWPITPVQKVSSPPTQNHSQGHRSQQDI